jgi:serine/threonine protein kinase
MGLPRPELVSFLQRVVPKVVEFGRLLDQDIGQCPDFAAVLVAGSTELVNLTVETSRTRLTGSVSMATTVRRPAPAPHETGLVATPPPGPASTLVLGGPTDLPEFSPAFAEEFPVGGCQLGPYELREQLGRGAMGVVFKAYEPSLDRFVAVKLLAPNLAASGTARQRFAREARVAAAIQHENVVTVYAVREAAGTAYLAMEYVKGWSLEGYLAKNGPPPVPVITRIARQIVAGLGAAHAKLITHRDIKPANILIADGPRGLGDNGRADGLLTAKISDFGLARAAHDASLSIEGALVGTPHFMSPEQIRGRPADARSDLFSLGGLFYVLCTGHLPFPGREVTAVLWAVCENQPVPPRELRPDLPEWLEDLVLRLLHKDPAKRCQSADEVKSILAARSGR